MSNMLYSREAELYYNISNDRDFKKELFNIGALNLKRNSIFVELFAGPAYHSICLENCGFEGKIYAIDSSSAMMKIARNTGFSGEYLCKDVNEALSEVEVSDLFFVPRYSIALINEKSLHDLISNIRKKFRKSSTLVLEIHKEEFLSRSQDINENWSNLKIQKRVVETSSSTISCIWPASIKELKSEPLIVEMDIIVEIEDKEKTGLKIKKFKSIENLHSLDTIKSIATYNGLKVNDERSFSTETSQFVFLGLIND